MDTNNTSKTPADDHAEQLKMLQVFTTAQEPAKQEELVFATARNGKNPDGTKREVDSANRYRCILIPEISIDGVPSKFHGLCLQALRTIAKQQFTGLWEENPQMREVPAAIWSVDSLLVFASREAESQRLTKENLATWFDSSDLAKRLMKKQDAKLLTAWKDRIVKLAAPTLDLSEDACNKLLVTISVGDAEDDNRIGRQLVSKLQNRITALQKQQEEVFEIVDAEEV